MWLSADASLGASHVMKDKHTDEDEQIQTDDGDLNRKYH